MAASSLSSVNTKIDKNILRDNISGHADNLLGFHQNASVDASTEQQLYKDSVSTDLNQRLNQCSEQESVRDLRLLVKQMDCILALLQRYPKMNISTPATDITAVPPPEEEYLSLLHAALDYYLTAIEVDGGSGFREDLSSLHPVPRSYENDLQSMVRDDLQRAINCSLGSQLQNCRDVEV
ncbi:Protein of unknown function [Pyronema omphalodes CBS 100304]|uniref:Uncharacterized protein n=1 Tax=Pyronema omphalodes (strain CBS 100304) TaxID=1076935 RepID=U4LRM9_PYROM|nr:Protein of unknown function [Pyronema omphalodes CBS 100304]